MGLGPGSENGRGRRSYDGSAEPDGAAAPGRAGDQEPPGARRIPHGAAAQVPAAQYPAAAVHKELGYTNIHTRVGDGYEGWPDAAPFDAIIVTCAPHRIPKPLLDQLKEGGRMVIPLGDRFTQSVHLVIKQDGKLIDKELKPTLFVPMTGKALKEKAETAPAPAPDPDQPRRKRRGDATKPRSSDG